MNVIQEMMVQTYCSNSTWHDSVSTQQIDFRPVVVLHRAPYQRLLPATEHLTSFLFNTVLISFNNTNIQHDI